VTDEVKYGGILFESGVPFRGVCACAEHVDVEFSHAALITEADRVLEGKGKGRRHLTLRTVGDIAAKKSAHFLPLALAAGEQGA